jgi:hypothetical protein
VGGDAPESPSPFTDVRGIGDVDGCRYRSADAPKVRRPWKPLKPFLQTMNGMLSRRSSVSLAWLRRRSTERVLVHALPPPPEARSLDAT